jgi:hypothetical protein
MRRVYRGARGSEHSFFSLNLCRPASIGTVRGTCQLFGISRDMYRLMIALQHHHLREDCLYLISCLLFPPFLSVFSRKVKGRSPLDIDFSLCNLEVALSNKKISAAHINLQGCQLFYKFTGTPSVWMVVTGDLCLFSIDIGKKVLASTSLVRYTYVSVQ